MTNKDIKLPLKEKQVGTEMKDALTDILEELVATSKSKYAAEIRGLLQVMEDNRKEDKR